MAGPEWQGRSKGTTLGYRIFIWLLRVGGLGTAYALLPLVTLWYRLFVPAAIRPLRLLYEGRLGYSSRNASKLIRKNLTIFGQTLIDKVAILAGIGQKLTFRHEGVEYFDEMIVGGEGGIIISAHLGNWEVAGHLLKRVGVPINILMYDGEGEQIKQLMEQYDSKRSFNIIYVKGNGDHIYEISAALTRNEFVCLHADRFRPGNRIIGHDFLGHKAQFPIGPFLLAAKLHAPVCYVFAFKESTFHYHFVANSPKKYVGRGNTGAESALDDYVRLLETGLRKHPEQWFNYYDFWAPAS